MKPSSRPKASSRTLARTARQLVVHDALETTTWRAGSKVSSFTPMTKVASAPLEGADTTTPRGAGVEMAGGVLAGGEAARGFHHHVDAEVAPGQCLHFALGGQQDPMATDDHDVAIGDDGLSNRPYTESRARRRASASGGPRSLIATTSRSSSGRSLARNNARPSDRSR